MADYTTVPLRRYYAFYTAGFFIFILILAFLERHGLPPRWIGYSFLFLTIFLYATIGVLARTASVSEYYVAGRRVPAVFNGMATGADWMSAASFMGLAGTLYLSGYQGLAYVMGWTGGYVLVACCWHPICGASGNTPSLIFSPPAMAAIRRDWSASLRPSWRPFVYVVAQIYGVGLITSRFVGLQFEIGVFVGLAGILVCSFLGGMRAVTWTQVAQYAILIVAYLVPVTILSYQVTGIPVPQLTYGLVLQKVQLLEEKIFADPAEIEARRIFRERADGYYERILTLPEVSRRRAAASSSNRSTN
jgi:cation/acetate symporter